MFILRRGGSARFLASFILMSQHMRNQDSNPFLQILFLICWDIRIRTWISGVRATVTEAKKISLQILGVWDTAGALTAQIRHQRWRRQCQNFQTDQCSRQRWDSYENCLEKSSRVLDGTASNRTWLIQTRNCKSSMSLQKKKTVPNVLSQC
jgi:hypothetical protein